MTTATPCKDYSSKDVMALTGLTYRQLDYWCRTQEPRHLIGSGYCRRFTESELLGLSVLAALLHVGAPLSVARESARRLAHDNHGAYLIVTPESRKQRPGNKVWTGYQIQVSDSLDVIRPSWVIPLRTEETAVQGE